MPGSGSQRWSLLHVGAGAATRKSLLRSARSKLADLPKGKRRGWHSLRRQWATKMKETPRKDLCYMGGWKSPMTVLTCYQQPDTETQREALAKRKRYRAGAGG